MDLPAQLDWLHSAFLLVSHLSRHCSLSCFILFITLTDDLDCGTELSSVGYQWLTAPWTLSMGPTTSSLFDDAVHVRRWICLGLRQVGLFPPPVPSFPSPSLLSTRLGDHVDPSRNLVNNNCLPLPASVCLLSRNISLPATIPHPIASLQSDEYAVPPRPFIVLDPDFPPLNPYHWSATSHPTSHLLSACPSPPVLEPTTYEPFPPPNSSAATPLPLPSSTTYLQPTIPPFMPTPSPLVAHSSWAHTSLII